MADISLCMIVKNEEKILGRCLESIKEFIDEIILVDTGSTDGTKEIGAMYDAIIYDFEWCEDFSKARNYSFSKATKEYILWLDADDYITPDNLKKLMQLKAELTISVDAVSMPYSLIRNEKGETTYSLRRNRLVKRALGFRWKGRIHEYLEVMGRTLHSEIEVWHDKDKPHTNRNIQIFKLMEEVGEVFTDRDLFYYANELYSGGDYEEAAKKYEAFLERGNGWIEDNKTATANLIQCYTMMQQEEKKVSFILESFKWGVPRADICCRMGEYFLAKQDYWGAVFWYKVALSCEPEGGNMGIDVKDYYTWIPSIQICLCYSNMGYYEKAYYYNEMTALYIPDSPKVAHNRKFVTGQLQEQGIPLPKYDKLLIKK